MLVSSRFRGEKSVRFSVILFVISFFYISGLRSQIFEISEVGITPGGEVVLSYNANDNSYYILFEGSTVTSVNEASALLEGTSDTQSLSGGIPDEGPRFYRILQLPIDFPGDIDGDGIDDVYELRTPSILNPLQASDALLDSDKDGRNNLREYEKGTNPLVIDDELTTLVTTSPFDGEGAVAVTRETILNFSSPVSRDLLTTPEAIYATFSGNRLTTRMELSGDGRKATLFYPSILPGSARVRVVIDGDKITDLNGNLLDADEDNIAGGITSLDFDTVHIQPRSNTSVSGRVFASELSSEGPNLNVPLGGVVITVDGQESLIRTTTDNQGNFTLENAPSGDFFVHIDGRTVEDESDNLKYPDLDYYPFVGKKWTGFPGQDNNVGNIFLPRVRQGTLKEVKVDEETIVSVPDEVVQEFPELEGVALVVPPNALFSDDGSRGGMVGIAPVDPDRLPGELPPGLEFPLVITVQTDGATNFDQPVPVCFPNLPDPVTGEVLPPGAKSALWSFNHDTGQFEVVGPMTVSADGMLICSDEGVGILAPGWHGSRRGGQLKHKREKCPSFGWRDAWKIAKQAFDCAKNLLGVKNGVKAAVEAADGIRDFYEFVGTVRERYKKGESLSGEVIKQLNSQKQRVAGVVNDFASAGNPVNKSLEAVKCVTGLTNIGVGFLCRSPKCQGRIARIICSVARPLFRVANDVANKADDIVDGFAKAPIKAACFAVDQLVKGFTGQSVDGNPSNTPVRLGVQTADPDPAILELFDEIIAKSQEGENNYRQFAALGTELDIISNELDKLQFDGLIQFAVAVGGLSNAPYKLTTDGDQVRRGKLSDSGQILVSVPPNVPYRFEAVVPSENLLIIGIGTTPQNGREGEFGPFTMIDLSTEPDKDEDLLADIAEEVLGSAPNDPDTDKDGILDGTEVIQGTDPLGDTRLPLGILSSISTAGDARDICAANNLILVADSISGLEIYNIFNNLAPLQISQVSTPGDALAVHCSGNLAAVADGNKGLTIVDITDPVIAEVLHNVPVGHTTSVATAGDLIAFTGLRSGEIAAVNMSGGQILQKTDISNQSIQDVFLAGDYLYVLDSANLHVIEFVNGVFNVLGVAPSPGGVNTAVGRNRLFVGGGIAYPTHRRGYNTIDVSNPLDPQLIRHQQTGQFGWKHIVLNGSGLGIAAVSPNQSFDGPHHVGIYDVSDPNNVNDFLFDIETPGVARAVNILNGFAYVADHKNGVQIINYSESDRAGVAPTITLDSSLVENRAEENNPIRVTANVNDDFQVSRVEFYLDDQRVSVDGNYPFEFRFIAPSVAIFESFVIKARALDTAGNFTWSEDMRVELVPDATPPSITRRVPDQGSGSDSLLSEIVIYLDELIDPSSVDENTLSVFGPGPDGVLGTEDDVLMSRATPEFNEETLAVIFTLDQALNPGVYRVVVSGQITDLRGNPIGMVTEWTVSSGQGITGSYFDGTGFNQHVFDRVDAEINFDWGTGSPDDRVQADLFSVRWQGAVVPEFTETYTFYTVSDDGVRLWVNGELIIDNWTVHPRTENSATVDLIAGQRADIKMEFFENRVFAVAQLLWSSESQEKQIIPSSRFIPFGILPPKLVEAISVNRSDEVGIVMDKPIHPDSLTPENFQLSSGHSILSVHQGTDPSHIVLKTSGLPIHLEDLMVTISNLRGDGEGAELLPAPISAPVFTGVGTISRKLYQNISSTSTADLVNNPNFPGFPDIIDYLDTFEIPANTADNYAVQLQAYLNAPENGEYIFHISSDDQSDLYLGNDKISLDVIASEVRWSGIRDYNRAGTVSDPINLSTDSSYFIQAIMREGGGGDNLSVAWQIPGGEPIVDGDEPISGEFLKAYAKSGTPMILSGPVNLSINEFEDATFSIDGFEGSTPYTIEWLLNGEPIFNESGPELTLLDVSAGLNGAALSARVTNAFGSYTTNAAELSVIPDLMAPIVTGISSSPDGAVLKINFDERLNRETASNPDNYSIEGIGITSVALDPTGTIVTLRTGGLESGRVYPIEISGIRDIAFNANLIEAKPYQVQPWLTLPKGGLTRIFYPGKGNVSMRDELYPLPRGMANYPADYIEDNISVVDLFETPVNVGSNYMVILTGYICPPETADYTFYMASDDRGELYLSTDSNPVNSRLIASEPLWNGSRIWTGTSNRNAENPENVSEPISLIKDQLYYVEAIMQEGTGGDNLGVAWTKTGDPEIQNGDAPIPGDALRALIPPPSSTRVYQTIPADGMTDADSSQSLSAFLIEGVLPVNTNSIRIWLNQKPYIPEITRSGGILNLKLPEGILDAATNYEARLTWTNTISTDIQEFIWNFKTESFPAGAIFIEAEDFNFENGQFIPGANGGPIGGAYPGGAYRDKVAALGVDFQDLGGGGSAYRTRDRIVGIGLNNSDQNRGAFNVEIDHIVGWNQIDEWRNYTRDFPAETTKYFAHARVGSRDERINIELAQVTSSASAPDQTKTVLGAFRGDPTGDFRRYKMDPLVDELGNPVPFELSGRVTLRMTTGSGSVDNRDNHDLNYIVMTPTREDRPSFFDVNPGKYERLNASRSIISLRMRENGQTVSTDSIQLYVRGQMVDIQQPIREGRNITIQSSSEIDFGFGERTPVSIQYKLQDGGELSESWDVVSKVQFIEGTRFIEAEDFNYSDEDGAGQWIPEANGGATGQPYDGGAYSNLSATEGTDFHEVDGAGSNTYRTEGPLNVGMATISNRFRGSFSVTSNHGIGWIQVGDWWNYTRNFPESPTRYEVFAQLSSGASDPNAFLELVSGDPTKPNQTTEILGNFSDAATGSYGVYRLYKLKSVDDPTSPLRITLSGLQTLRLRNGEGNMNVDYLIFVPIP